MAAAPLLGSCINFKKPLYLQSQLHSPSALSLTDFKIRTCSPKLRIKCFVITHSQTRTNLIDSASTDHHHHHHHNENNKIRLFAETNDSGLFLETRDYGNNMIRALVKPATAAVVVGFLFLVNTIPNAAFAATGGRMGGGSFSSGSRSSSSSSSSSRSYSSSSSSSSRPRYSSSSSSSGDVDGLSSSVSANETSAVTTHQQEVARNFFFGFLCGIAVVCVVYFIFSSQGSKVGNNGVRSDPQKTSVVKMQVCMSGSRRSLQKELNKIAETANTSTPEGLRHILTETIVALLRHPDYWISSSSSVDLKQSTNEGEQIFNKLSIQERSKFDEETLVNVGNIKKKAPKTSQTSGNTNEYIVTTILVAARGELELPTISNSSDLKKALETLASIPSTRILSVEVLWTPQEENDTLSEEELLEDYPSLRPLLSVV